MRLINWEYLSMSGKPLMRGFCLALAAVAVCFSCTEKTPATAPDDLLGEQDMISIMIDIYGVEARIASYGQNFDSSMAMFNLVEEDLLARYGASRDQYKRSVQYYYDNPEKLLVIYEAVVDSLSYRERKMSEESGRKEE